MTFYQRETIDSIYNKFIRPLFFDFSLEEGRNDYFGLSAKSTSSSLANTNELLPTMGSVNDFSKIQTKNALKTLASEVIAIEPEITSERLLERYDLSDNPRVMEIFKKLNIG